MPRLHASTLTHAAVPHTLSCACFSPGRRAFTGLLLGAAAAPALAVVPECKRSVATKLVSASTVEGSAQQQYAQLLGQARGQGVLAPEDHPQLRRLRYIAARIVPLTTECNERARDWRWEINLLANQQVNAFCMPGGKIAFFSGILSKLRLNDDEVAVVMGHEVGHALLEHARERLAKSTGTNLALRLGAAALGLGGVGDMAAQGLAGLASLRFGRSDESEADALGLVLAARAGYDPRAGVSLWQKMGALSGNKAPPEWFSTHPPGNTRIKDIQARLPRVLPAYESSTKPPQRFEPARQVP
jgi:predicted Zn-dependent protease